MQFVKFVTVSFIVSGTNQLCLSKITKLLENINGQAAVRLHIEHLYLEGLQCPPEMIDC
jgi:hypothetical protein